MLSINPRTEQVSFAKGLDLGNNKGVININGEWTKATQKLVSPILLIQEEDSLPDIATRSATY